MFKACWIESKNQEKLKEFRLRKYQQLATDKEGREVYMAESPYALQMARRISLRSPSTLILSFDCGEAIFKMIIFVFLITKDRFMKATRLLILIFLTFSSLLWSQRPDWEGGYADGCTTITAGRGATADGSVITSHTDDSHRTRSWMDVIPAQKHGRDEFVTMYKRVACDSFKMPSYAHEPIGKIPQVKETYQFLNTAYPSMNQYQVGIGESTFGGREELAIGQSDLIDCQRLCKLMLERSKSAVEAIEVAGELLDEFGWNDFGECLTIADKREVWHLEIVGPGKDRRGAVWVAQRVPDRHIAVNANASTIKEIDLNDRDNFMASDKCV